MTAKARANRFWRLIITLPGTIAEPFGAALVALGAEAVEERPSADPAAAELHVVVPDRESVATWQSLVPSMWKAFAEELRLPEDACQIHIEEFELDFHGEWLKHLTSQRLTNSIVLVPTTAPAEVPATSRQLFFEPHPSFGDGTHATTRLAARAAEQFCTEHPGCSVLDVGTGNGVLSLVAALSGAKTALGLDIDEAAVQVARENAKRNQLAHVCAFAARSLASVGEQFDLVLANLEPRTQLELLGSIAARTKPGGILVLTGFLREQAQDITAPLCNLGFRRVGSGDEDGYALEAWQSSAPGMTTPITPDSNRLC
jgi:ribosomal protein L11 methyltransferase